VRLVALKVPDEMPRRIEVPQLLPLGLKLLHTVLSEMPQTGVVGRTNRISWECLPHGHDANPTRVPASSCSSLSYTLVHKFQVCRNSIAFVHRGRDSSMQRRATHLP